MMHLNRIHVKIERQSHRLQFVFTGRKNSQGEKL